MGDIDPGFKEVLERMEPAERLLGLRRIFRHSDDFGSSDRSRKEITPLLLGMGHSEAEIRSLFPPEKKD